MMGSMRASVIPHRGFVAIPHTGVGNAQTRRMRPRDVLAENLKKLMAGKPELKTFPLITAAGGGSNGTLDRIRRKTTATSIDNLEPLASVFGLEPWHLLVASLAVEDGVTVGLPGWPLTMVDQARYDALTEPQKGFVQARMLDAIKECEANKQAKQVLRKMGAKKDSASDQTVEARIPATKTLRTPQKITSLSRRR